MLKTATIAGLLLASSIATPLAAQDSKQWLESPTDDRALVWAKQQTVQARAKIAAMPNHAAIEAELKTLLAAGDPPPDFMLFGPTALRFQRSVAHPHGVLSVGHRAGAGEPGGWRDVLDVDALRKAEGKAYELRFFSSFLNCAPPDYTRCMLSLAPAGGDDVELREFDLTTGRFVDDGFRTPASRALTAWLDRDHLLIEHAVGGAATLPTGWPATVSIWSRGTPLSEAKVVYRAQPSDSLMSVNATGEGRDRVGVISRSIDYSTIDHIIVRPDGTTETTPIPRKVKMIFSNVGGGRIFAQLGEAATIGGKSFPAESIVAYDTRQGVAADRRLALVYLPSDGEFMSDPFFGFEPGRTTLKMVLTRRGTQRIVTAVATDAGWNIVPAAREPVGTAVSFEANDPESDAVIAKRGGYLVPSRLELIDGAGPATQLYAEKPVFDPSAFVVELKSASSRDGTAIDYFLLRPRVTGKAAMPLLMTGYGAFGVSFSPEYLGAEVGGKSLVPWLKRGGALALPMIRGGGERGEAWHQAAIREKRQNSYDDFVAVTNAIIKDGLTTPAHIGVFGSSNGGLLAAVMGTQHPELYGAIVSDVPLTDLIRMPYMGMGAAWVNEYGDTRDPAMRAAIERYSPFQNVVAGKRYPPFMLTAAASDNRVGPGHARKLASRLEDAGATVYYLEDQEGGHGVSDPLSRPELMADRMTFLIDTLGPK